MVKLKASQILKILINLERYGYETYSKMADECADKEIKNIFVTLSNDELKHKNIYENMQLQLGNVDLDMNEQDVELIELILSYNFSILDQNYSSHLKEIKSSIKALELAENMERDTLTFLQTMLEYCSGDLIEVLKNIIKEEKNHMLLILRKKFDTEMHQKVDMLKLANRKL